MTDSTFWKKISPAVDINDLAGEAEPKSDRIKPGSPADILAAQSELTAWLERKPAEVCHLGGRILSHLQNAARWPSHAKFKEWLVEDVAKLALLSRK